jgi:hypothetical protein
MATLNTYLQQLQRFTREAKQDFINPADMVSYINRARREVAWRAQCVRRLTPISGSVITATITNTGSGYVSPVATISAPDFPPGVAPYPNGDQATAAVTQVGGAINSIQITYGGHGYFQPQITITDSHSPGGTGATATLSLSPINVVVQAQEVYPFSGIDVTGFPGIDSVYMIKSVSLIYSNYRYSLPMYAFSVYQAMIRNFPFQYEYVPTFCSQFGQGADGSFYLYPLPSQTYQIEYDCFCTPQDLIDNQSVDVIPQPWTDAVSYFAASLCFEEIQNLNAATYYANKFDAMLLRYSQYARPGRMINPYGRYLWWIAAIPAAIEACLRAKDMFV